MLKHAGRACLLFVALLGRANGHADPWRIEDFGTTDPDELVMYSILSGDDGIKERIRSYLARNVAATPAGLFSEQWIKGYEAKWDDKVESERIGLMQRCISIDAKYLPCLSTLAAFYSDATTGKLEDAVRLDEQIITLDPNFDSKRQVWSVYRLLYDQIKDASRARALLETYRARLGDSYIFDYVDAMTAFNEKKYRDSLRLLTTAKTKSDAPFLVWQGIAELETSEALLYDIKAGKKKVDIASNILGDFLRSSHATQHEKRKALHWFEDAYGSLVEISAQQGDFFDAESHLNPHGSAQLFSMIESLSNDVKARTRLLEWVPNPDATEVPTELLAWGVVELRAGGEIPRILAAWRRAIANDYTARSRQWDITLVAAHLRDQGYCEQGAMLLGELRRAYPTKSQKTMDFDLAICALNVAQAHQALETYKKVGPIYRGAYERLARLEEAERSGARFTETHAFLVDWYRQFGDRPEIDVKFASNSATVPAGALGELGECSQLLRQPNAGKIIFEVGGYTDSLESGKGSATLSEQRAKAVVDVLLGLGVPQERLRSKGYGSALPRATNQTEAGRQINRRVELRIIVNVGDPQIAAELGLPASDRILPLTGGRWAVLGADPAYRVDLTSRTRVATYKVGVPKALVAHERYLVCGFDKDGADGVDRSGLVVYDVRTGDMIARREFSGSALWSGLAVSPGQDQLAIAQGNNLVILDAESLRTRRIAHVSDVHTNVRGIAWLRSNKIAVAWTAFDKVYIVDATSLHTERVLTGVTWVHSLAESGDGKFLVAGDNGGLVHVWDTTTWHEHGQMQTGHGIPDQLATRADTAEFVVGGNGTAALRIDAGSLQVLDRWRKPDKAKGTLPVAYSANGQFLYREDIVDWKIKNLESGEISTIPTESGGNGIVSIHGFAEANRLLIRSSRSGVAQAELFDMTTLGRVYDFTPYIGSNTIVTFQTGEQIQFTDPQSGRWQRFDAGKLKFVEDGQISNADVLTSLRSVDDKVYLGSKGIIALSHDAAAGEASLHIGVRDNSGKLLRKMDLNLLTESLRPGAYRTGFVAALSTHERYLAVVPTWQDGYGMPTSRSKHVYVVDTDAGTILHQWDFISAPFDIKFDGAALLVQFGNEWRRFDLATERSVVEDYGDERYQTIDPDARIVYRTSGMFLEKGDRIVQYADTFDQLDGDIAVFKKLNLLVDLVDGLLEVRSTKDLSVKFRFRARSAGEWIAYTEDGYFTSSPHGTDGLFWNVGEDYLPFSALRDRFERPDLFRRAGAMAPHPTALSRSAVAATTEYQSPSPATASLASVAAKREDAIVLEYDLFAPPYSVAIAGDAHRVVSTDSEQIPIIVTRLRKTKDPYQLEFMLNGRVLPATVVGRGITAVEKNCESDDAVGCVMKQSFQADLQEGLNVIQVSLVYHNVRLNPQTITRQRTDATAAGSPQASRELARLPRLWFFGVGVSHYANNDISLQYADADAVDLAKAFGNQGGRMFSEVNVKTLIDGQATAEEVRLELNRFLRAATQQDIVVVFLAGHGVLDETQTLYFMTYDAKVDEPFSGFDVGVLHDVLGKRPPGQKAIVILDICHAGAVGASRTRAGGAPSASDDALKLLAEGSGVKVLTASTAREESQEGAQFGGGHGAFTSALLEGIDGAAVDGHYVTVSSLERFVMQRVQQTTGNRQHPTSSSDRFQDYPLALIN
jgi:outer membrane protein OmpA-like peptidoglycan-associated protein/WD40 repeat protein